MNDILRRKENQEGNAGHTSPPLPRGKSQMWRRIRVEGEGREGTLTEYLRGRRLKFHLRQGEAENYLKHATRERGSSTNLE